VENWGARVFLCQQESVDGCASACPARQDTRAQGLHFYRQTRRSKSALNSDIAASWLSRQSGKDPISGRGKTCGRLWPGPEPRSADGQTRQQKVAMPIPPASRPSTLNESAQRLVSRPVPALGPALGFPRSRLLSPNPCPHRQRPRCRFPHRLLALKLGEGKCHRLLTQN
jgi:hypothetical protein